MPNRQSYFNKLNRPFSVFLFGKAGKTMCKEALLALFHGQVEEFDSVNGSLTDFVETHGRSEKLLLYEVNLKNEKQRELLFSFITPDIVMVTNFGEGHLVYQSSKIDSFQLVKDYLKTLPKQTLYILNKDDDLVSQFDQEIDPFQIVKFGLNQQSTIYSSNIQQLGPDGISFRLNDVYHLRVPIYQFQQIYNVLAAIAVARVFNFSFEEISTRMLNYFKVPEGKGNLVEMGQIRIINDTFKNTKSNVATAAQTLVTFKNYSNRMIMVIGEIDPEGADSYSIHMNMGHFLSALPIDVIITVGEKTKPIFDVIENSPFRFGTALHATDVQEAVMLLCLMLEQGDCILLKSNRDSHLTEFISILKKSYNP